MIWPPTAPWMAILNCCLGISSLRRSHTLTPHSRARSLWTIMRQGVQFLAVHQDVQLQQAGFPVVDDLVIKRAVALGDGLEAVVEVDDDFGQGHVEVDFHPARARGS